MYWQTLILASSDLNGFEEIWLILFIWVLFSSIFIHSIIAILSFLSLHNHSYGRWYAPSVALMGIIMPLTGGVMTSAVIAGVYHSLRWSMPPRVALIWGGGQTAMVVGLSLTRLLPTL